MCALELSLMLLTHFKGIEKISISNNFRSIDTGTDPFLEQRTTSGMTAPGTRHSPLDTAPISTSNKVGGSLRRLPHQALSMPNTEYDDHPYEMPRVWIFIIVSWGKTRSFQGMRYPYTDVRQLGMATPSDAVDTSPTIQEIPPAPSTRTHSLMSSTAPPVPPRLGLREIASPHFTLGILATRRAIQTSPASTENITALSHRRYSQAACPVPTTTTCSTPGSRTAERDDQADISIRPILRFKLLRNACVQANIPISGSLPACAELRPTTFCRWRRPRERRLWASRTRPSGHRPANSPLSARNHLRTTPAFISSQTRYRNRSRQQLSRRRPRRPSPPLCH